MKILPIESNPYIRAFTYHAFPSSILGSKRFCGEQKADFTIDQSDRDQWTYHTNNVSIDNTQNNYLIYGSNYADDIKACLYRTARPEDEIVIKIRYIQYTQPYGYISLFLSNDEINDFENIEHCNRIGIYNKGDIFSGNHPEVKLFKSISYTNVDYYLKLEKKNDQLLYWFSYNAKEWELITNNKLEDYTPSQKLYIGVYLYLGENQYYNWLYTNNIQLYGRTVFSTEYFIDYFVTPDKDGHFYTVHSLLDFNRISKSILQNSGIDMIKFFQLNIDKGQYIDIMLNEYYLKETISYKIQSHYHENMFYGYDDTYFYYLGYTKGGYIKTNRLEYSDFIKAIDNHVDYIYVFAFVPLDSYFKLNINTIKAQLYEYWKGIDTYQRLDYILPKDINEKKSTTRGSNKSHYDNKLPDLSNIYGMKLYDLFLKDDTMFHYMLRDLRIPYIIFEHKKIMKDRIIFLQQKKHIKLEYIDEILTMTNELYNKASYLLRKYIKYQMRPNHSDDLRKNLTDMRTLEEIYYPKLLESLY